MTTKSSATGSGRPRFGGVLRPVAIRACTGVSGRRLFQWIAARWDIRDRRWNFPVRRIFRNQRGRATPVVRLQVQAAVRPNHTFLSALHFRAVFGPLGLRFQAAAWRVAPRELRSLAGSAFGSSWLRVMRLTVGQVSNRMAWAFDGRRQTLVSLSPLRAAVESPAAAHTGDRIVSVGLLRLPISIDLSPRIQGLSGAFKARAGHPMSEPVVLLQTAPAVFLLSTQRFREPRTVSHGPTNEAVPPMGTSFPIPGRRGAALELEESTARPPSSRSLRHAPPLALNSSSRGNGPLDFAKSPTMQYAKPQTNVATGLTDVFRDLRQALSEIKAPPPVSAAHVDIGLLTRQVSDQLERELRIEKERRGL